MKITKNNYFDKIKEIGFENLPLVLKQTHTVIMVKTDNGKDWTLYKNDKDLKRMIDLAFTKLEEFIQSDNNELSGTLNDSPEVKRAKADAKNYPNLSTSQLRMIYRLEKDAELEDGQQEWITIRKNAIEKEIRKRGETLDGVRSEKSKKKNPYSLISKEVQFIQRFLDFDGKILYKKTFEIFIDELQKAIEEKKITKKSPVAKDIMAIQQAALAAFNSMSNAKHFVLKPTTIKHLKGIIEKYENAYDDIDVSYVKTKKKKMDLSGINQTPQVNIMPSTDFTNLHFNTIGFKEKWLAFIGDPAPGFTAMVFGMPKMGKSYLCVDFAGYLARNHGKVLYVAKEEKLDKTLQDKLNDKQVAHENLFVSDALPADLTGYDFIILDSVNKLGFTPKDLNKLKTENPGKSFIYVFQATKGGQFKGNNEFQHDVDVVIEVPEQGKAVQYGRFNQGGEMNIFEESSPVTEDEQTSLSGIAKIGNKKPMVIKPTFSTPLEEFDFLIQRGESVQEAIRANKSEAEKWVKKLVEAEIKKVEAEAKVENVYFLSNDDEADDEAEGLSYYDLRISGLENELRKVAGKDKNLDYDWQDKGDFSGTKKNSSAKSESNSNVKKKIAKVKDWTEPDWLDQADWQSLKRIKKYCDKGEYKEAMNYAMDCDTVIREEIPGDIWKRMGGQLTKTGEEKLKAESSFYGDTPEANNPKFLFQKTSPALLASILDGVINIDYCVREELANRGLDQHGDWVGFVEAARIHKIKK